LNKSYSQANSGEVPHERPDPTPDWQPCANL
jgi:hypothetical protein